jgi:hypothetical protein
MDFSHVKYISSAGIGAIAYLQKKIMQLKGILVISGTNTEISNLFSALGLNKFFILIQNKDIAVTKIIKEELPILRPVEKLTENAAKDSESNMESNMEDTKENSESHIENTEENTKSDTETQKEDDDTQGNLDFESNNKYHKEEKKVDTNTIDIESKEIIKENDSSSIKKSIAFNSFIWECPNCKNMMQITYAGANSCSKCFKTFIVNEDQTVSF